MDRKHGRDTHSRAARPKKRKFVGNIHTRETETTFSSTLAQKLSTAEDREIITNPGHGYRTIMHPAKYLPRPQPRKSNISCIVKGCESSSQKNVELSFHAFPKMGERLVNVKNHFDCVEPIDRFAAWTRALRIKQVKGTMRVCALHFTKDDYLFPDAAAKKRFLKKNAVPTINLPSNSGLLETVKRKEIAHQRLERRLKRNDTERLGAIIPQEKTIQIKTYNSSSEEETGEDSKPTNSDLNHSGDVAMQRSLAQSFHRSFDRSFGHPLDNTFSADNYICAECKESVNSVLTGDLEIQVKTDEILPNFLDLFPTDSALSIATGIESYMMLDGIVNLVAITLQIHPNHYDSIMSLRHKVVMTYVKLKQNITYSFLAGLFQYYTAQHCERAFLEMIDLLCESLKVALKWLSKEEISRNLPQSFEGFEDTRAVIDCTEIFIERPSKLCCQATCYSQYEKSPTFKVMTAVTPAGTISYISKPYDGRVFDTDIFEHSDLKYLLEPEDGVMVDRGFLIDEMCAERGWRLIRPPLLKEKEQFCKSESSLTCNIAKARVHIERLNQKIKTFSILGDTMPASLLPVAEKILTIVCATMNLSSPILSNDKFMEGKK